MKSFDDFFAGLWKSYTDINMQAESIHGLLSERGEEVVNDHIAFRTFNIPTIGIEALAQHFKKHGYEEKGEYEFKAKKLDAKHFEHPDNNNPRIFISELKIEEFSDALQSTVRSLASQVPKDRILDDSFPISGRLWSPTSWDVYLKLKEESEYAAWMSVFGFRPNHFTVLLNGLNTFKTLEEFNEFIKLSGYKMNGSGGEIKGSSKELLEQSSTMAHQVEVEFSDRKETVPSCYYEFARRYPMKNGKLFMGFIAKSADKIFESTDNKDNG